MAWAPSSVFFLPLLVFREGFLSGEMKYIFLLILKSYLNPIINFLHFYTSGTGIADDMSDFTSPSKRSRGGLQATNH